jgi:hypothetical protein
MVRTIPAPLLDMHPERRQLAVAQRGATDDRTQGLEARTSGLVGCCSAVVSYSWGCHWVRRMRMKWAIGRWSRRIACRAA